MTTNTITHKHTPRDHTHYCQAHSDSSLCVVVAELLTGEAELVPHWIVAVHTHLQTYMHTHKLTTPSRGSGSGYLSFEDDREAAIFILSGEL